MSALRYCMRHQQYYTGASEGVPAMSAGSLGVALDADRCLRQMYRNAAIVAKPHERGERREKEQLRREV